MRTMMESRSEPPAAREWRHRARGVPVHRSVGRQGAAGRRRVAADRRRRDPRLHYQPPRERRSEGGARPAERGGSRVDRPENGVGDPPQQARDAPSDPRASAPRTALGIRTRARRNGPAVRLRGVTHRARPLTAELSSRAMRTTVVTGSLSPTASESCGRAGPKATTTSTPRRMTCLAVSKLSRRSSIASTGCSRIHTSKRSVSPSTTTSPWPASSRSGRLALAVRRTPPPPNGG